VDPRHFRAAPSVLGGMGLFCELDLEPGDIWYLNNPQDPRYVARMVKIEENVATLSEDWFKQNGVNPILWHYDFILDRLVAATEPFCRVNHSLQNQNSDEDAQGNSYMLSYLKAGSEILDPYDYEAIFSLAWKFREFHKILSEAGNYTNEFLRSPVAESKLAMDFLAAM